MEYNVLPTKLLSIAIVMGYKYAYNINIITSDFYFFLCMYRHMHTMSCMVLNEIRNVLQGKIYTETVIYVIYFTLVV